MQYRIILSTVLLMAGFLSADAQQKRPALKPTVNIATKADSTKPGKGNTLLAAKMSNESEKGYTAVPLAGQASYFGDKTEYVNNFVRKYLEKNNQTLGSVKNNSAKAFSVIDNVLEKKNLPKELKYLAVIESALNHNAVSHAGAVGPWQLMESTAKLMGLTVSRRKDERTDWYKSTNAATKYLEVLYGQLNDWLLVIAAYNSGPTPVQRAIERTGSRSFWDIKEYLPKETQGHVLAFIATASIFENLSKFINLGSVPVDFKFGKDDDTPPPPPPGVSKDVSKASSIATAAIATTKKAPAFTDDELKAMTIVRITEPMNIETAAAELGVDKKLMGRWNADIDQFNAKTYPTPFYNLRLPKEKLDAFLQKKDDINKKSKAALAQLK